MSNLYDKMRSLNPNETDFAYNNLKMDYAICAAIANSDLEIYATDLHGILSQKYGTSFGQLNFIMENADKLNTFNGLDHKGKVINIENGAPQISDSDINNYEKEEINNSFIDGDDEDRITDEEYQKNVDKRTDQIVEENAFLESREERNNIFKNAMNQSSINDDDKVYFNYEYFNTILYNKKEIDDHISPDYEPTSMFGLGMDLLNDIDEEKDQNADIRSDTKIKAYITLNERSKRSLSEKLKHPIKSLFELHAKNKIARELKNEFGLSKDTLNTISDKIMQDNHLVENGREIFDKNFICFDKNGRMITTETSLEECQKAANKMFPSDKNEQSLEDTNLISTSKRTSQSLDNLANDTLTEEVNLNKSEKHVSTEHQYNKEIGKD